MSTRWRTLLSRSAQGNPLRQAQPIRPMASICKLPPPISSDVSSSSCDHYNRALETNEPIVKARVYSDDPTKYRHPKPPEEDLFEKGDRAGYFTDGSVNRFLKHYKIARKIGWGATSSVWLVLDTSRPETSYAALKVVNSFSTECIIDNISHEINVFRKIESGNPGHPGFGHCLTRRDTFLAESWNGIHICIATDPLGHTLGELRGSTKQPFNMATVKRIMKQLLLAVDFLHRECGYIHLGITAEHILTRLPEPVHKRINEFVRDPRNMPSCQGYFVEHESFNLPMFYCQSEPLPYLDLEGSLEDLSICLAGFSDVYPVDKPTPPNRAPATTARAPEFILYHPWSSAIDIWAIGCLAFTMLTDRDLFQQTGDYSAELHLQNMTEYIGPFSESFLRSCDHSKRTRYFHDKDTSLRTKDFTPCSLESMLRLFQREMHMTSDEDDLFQAAAFIRRCLAIDPTLRPPAHVLLRDKWLL